MTNHHVINCKADAAVAVALFHFEQENQGMEIQLKPDKLFKTNAVSCGNTLCILGVVVLLLIG